MSDVRKDQDAPERTCEEVRAEARERLQKRLGAHARPTSGRVHAARARIGGAARHRAKPSFDGLGGGVRAFVRRFLHDKFFVGVTLLAIAAIVTVVTLAFPSMVSRDDAGLTEEERALQEDIEARVRSNVEGNVFQDDAAAYDAAVLPSDMDPTAARTLREAARSDEDAAFVLLHATDYARYGEYYAQLLELAAEEPTARPFVAQMLQKYPSDASAGLDASDVSEDADTGEGSPAESGDSNGSSRKVPRLYQWDVRWGFQEYSSGPLGVTGCCPTSLCMTYTALTGKTDRSPADLADFAEEHGYVSENEGTFAELLEFAAPELGLTCEILPLRASSISIALRDGAVVICNVGPGEFTEAGHFFVIARENEDGTLAINDPYSTVRSDQAWDSQRIVDQAIGLYAFRAAS